MLLLMLLMFAVSSQAGVISNEIPLINSLTNAHSPTAFSHQSITQIHTNERKVLLKPLRKTPLHQTFHKENENLESIEYPHTHSVENEHNDVSAKVEHAKGAEYGSFSPYISYNDNTPLFTSQTYTPAHLTYAASPVVYKMLPLVIKGPYRSYEKYLTKLNYK